MDPNWIRIQWGPWTRIRIWIRKGIVDTGGKFATGINNTSETVAKFAAVVVDTNDTGGNFAAGVVDTGGKFATGSKFATGVVDTGGAP